VPVLVCQKCQIYYEIDSKEELDDLSPCNCGEDLEYYESLDEYLKISSRMSSPLELGENPNDKKEILGYRPISKKVIMFASSSFFILIVALILSSLVGAGVFSSTDHYPGPWCSFDYPQDWKISTTENMGLNDPQMGFIVISLWDPSDKKHLTSFTYTRYIKDMAEAGFAHEYDLYQEIKPVHAKITSNKTISLMGRPAYELQFTENTSSGLVKGVIYIYYDGEDAFVFKAPEERYPDINKQFNIILNSFSYVQG
jgi:hypothetical protein